MVNVVLPFTAAVCAAGLFMLTWHAVLLPDRTLFRIIAAWWSEMRSDTCHPDGLQK
jgi:hypothetical protein